MSFLTNKTTLKHMRLQANPHENYDYLHQMEFYADGRVEFLKDNGDRLLLHINDNLFKPNFVKY